MSAVPAVNIAAALPAQARAQPHTLAIVEPHGDFRAGRASYRHLTYRELDAESDRLARGLEKIGVGRGCARR
jgi:non-ribosomal peptide synthetase component F